MVANDFVFCRVCVLCISENIASQLKNVEDKLSHDENFEKLTFIISFPCYDAKQGATKKTEDRMFTRKAYIRGATTRRNRRYCEYISSNFNKEIKEIISRIMDRIKTHIVFSRWYPQIARKMVKVVASDGQYFE